MEPAVVLIEEYICTKDRMLYTRKEHQVPGVNTLGHYIIKNASLPMEWHYHENTFEFTVATKGTISFCTNSSTYKFSGGDVMMTFPDEIHGTNNIPVDIGEIYWFQIDISDPKNFLYLNESAASDIIRSLKAIPHHVIHASAEDVQPLLKQALTLASQGAKPSFIAAHLLLFLQHIINSSNNANFLLTPDIGRTLNYILDNITSELPLEELASIANLSCSQYKQKFKRQLGLSPRRYINQQKIEEAKVHLLEGMSVIDTAMLLGFSTSSYFSAVFKKYTFYTPLEYVKSMQNRS